jgi:hypothetical protein
MPKLFEEILDKYIGATDDKQSSPFRDKIMSSLEDSTLQNEWLLIKSKKNSIKAEPDYKEYVQILRDYFNKVCQKIMAPGVDAFIDWIISLGVSSPHLSSLRDFLINNYQYAEVAEKVDFIQSAGKTVEFDANSNKIFNRLIKAANKEIKEKVIKLLEKPTLFENTVQAFLDDMESELKAISELEQLSFTDINELYSDEDKQKEIDFYKDVIVDAIEYIQNPQMKYPIQKGTSISAVIGNKIQDLNTFISLLGKSGIAQSKDDRLKSIFERSSGLIVGKEGTLQDNWAEFENKTWLDLETYYATIKDFFTVKKEVHIGTLRSAKQKWNISTLTTDLRHLIDKYLETIEKNPLETLSNYSTANGLKNELSKKWKVIEEVKVLAADVKEKLFTLLTEKVAEYNDNKLPIIGNIVSQNSLLVSDVQKINECISALNRANTDDYKSKDIMVFFSHYFDVFYEYLTTIDATYTTLLGKAGMKENIEWLQNLINGSEEFELAEAHLKDVKILNELLKYNLVKLTLTRTN